MKVVLFTESHNPIMSSTSLIPFEVAALDQKVQCMHDRVIITDAA
jgi:hypothetical protein